MQSLIRYLYERPKLTFVTIFLLAFVARAVLIYKTPGQHRALDLSIYIDSGQLLSNGVNPYDFSDSPELRHALRTDSVAVGWQCETQERWNYYANGNLPLTLLLFGAIDSISTGNALLYRCIFALSSTPCFPHSS